MQPRGTGAGRGTKADTSTFDFKESEKLSVLSVSLGKAPSATQNAGSFLSLGSQAVYLDTVSKAEIPIWAEKPQSTFQLWESVGASSCSTPSGRPAGKKAESGTWK